MAGFSPTGLGAFAEAIETQTLPNATIPNSAPVFYPRIWCTGTLEADINAIRAYATYYTTATVTVTNTDWRWGEMGCEAGTAGNYVQEARVYQHAPQFREMTQGEITALGVEAEQRRLSHQAAAERARELLESCLDVVQLAQWRALKAFIVLTNGRQYKLAEGHEPRRVDADGHPLFTYCIHVPNVPRCDELLAHKLLLEANEAEWLRTANATVTVFGRRCLPTNFAGALATPVPPHVQMEIGAEDSRLALAS